MTNIKGILFDKDGTLVDFQKTWFAIGDLMALQAAGGDRARADELMAEAGYDYGAHCFRADSVFAAGTNADIVALWYPQADAVARQGMTDIFRHVYGGAGRGAVGRPARQPRRHRQPAPFGLPAWRRHQRFDRGSGKDAAGARHRADVRRRLRL